MSKTIIKERTPEERKQIEKNLVPHIESEGDMQDFADANALSVSFAYAIAKNLGYAKMLVSTTERDMIRKHRRTMSRFKTRRAVA